MNESNPSDQELAELLTLTVEVDELGTTIYRNNLGQVHRVHGPAIIYLNGDTWWYLYDKCHRTDGPAVETGNSESWFQNGLRHRTNGPAVEYVDGSKSWYLYGELLSKREFYDNVRSK